MMRNRAGIGLTLSMAVLVGCDQGKREVSPPAADNAEVATTSLPQPEAQARPNVPSPASGPSSVFTSLDPANCDLIARNDEDAGYARHRCDGAAGFRVEVVESDLRQTIELIRPDRRVQSLELSALVAGGGFSSLGKSAEWRGIDPAAPRTLTVRYGVNENPDPKIAPRSYLVVARLESPACVVARISPGPQQSAQARAVADQAKLPSCFER